MWIGIALGVFGMGLLVWQAEAAMTLTSSVPARRVMLGVAVAAGLVAAVIFFGGFSPGEPSGEGTLAAPGDSLTLGSGAGGRLILAAEPVGESARDRVVIVAKLQASGGAGKQPVTVQFQRGEVVRGDEIEVATLEHLGANVELPALGDGAAITLLHLAPPDTVRLRAAFVPERFPMAVLLWLLTGIAVIGALLEAAGRSSYRRTFFTAALSGVTGLAWLVSGGLPPGSGAFELPFRIAYSIGIAAVVGTLGPMILGALLPKSLPAPNRD